VSSIPHFPIDLNDTEEVIEALRSWQPTEIYHLAGYADAGRSLFEPELAWRANLQATQSLYDAVLDWGGRPRVLYVGSGLVYGEVTGAPLTEVSEFKPRSPYAASKAAADLLSYQVHVCTGLEIVRARPFNHIGPGQSPSYAVPNFARQIAAIEVGRQKPLLQVGNLGTERDFTDVRDVVGAYHCLMKHALPGEPYHVASGVTVSVRSVLDRLLRQSSVPITVETDPRLLRSIDTSAIRVDNSKLRQFGWRPRFDLEQTLGDTLEDWRRRGAQLSS
jgi:GDP-4-dehydro-6-deoxy-D-mannose reductase